MIFNRKFLLIPVFQHPYLFLASAPAKGLVQAACGHHHRISSIDDLNGILGRYLLQLPAVQLQRIRLHANPLFSPKTPAFPVACIDIVIQDPIPCPACFSQKFIFFQIPKNKAVCLQTVKNCFFFFNPLPGL